VSSERLLNFLERDFGPCPAIHIRKAPYRQCEVTLAMKR
jgi:hypothetical protein